MPTYFLDTSALVKRHVAEPGHAWVRALCNPRVGNTIVVAEITLVEVVATFSRMVRETPRRLTLARRDRVIADFEARFLRQYTIAQVDRALLTRAATLCRTHPLRATTRCSSPARSLGAMTTSRPGSQRRSSSAPMPAC